MVRRLFLSGSSIAGRDETGDIVAAASVFVDGSGHRTATGLVHPSTRWQGIGEELVQWAQERAGGVPLRVVAETTSPASDALFAQVGLQRTFAEHVMRHPLLEIPRVPRAARAARLPLDRRHGRAVPPRLPPVVRDPSRASPTPRSSRVGRRDEADPGFRRDDSRVVLDDDGHVAGFVTLTDDWLDQVGVVPAWRGQGLGAHLVVRSLRALRKAGCEQAWLAVNVDNPAHDLYLRLGFEDHGVRARYAEVGA